MHARRAVCIRRVALYNTNGMKKGLCLVMTTLFLCLSGFASSGKSDCDARRVPVLMYHSVCRTNVGEYVASPETLRADFRYLREKGYTAVFVRDIIEYCDGKGELPEKPIVITFDDGFYNNAFYAEKIAAEYGMKMTVSVVGSYVQKEDGVRKRSPVYSYLNREEIGELYRGGRVEFANHTYDLHKINGGHKGVRRKSGESPADYEARLVADSEKCRKLVQDACGYRMNVFAYPFGCYSKDTGKILAKLGYRAILTCQGGINTFRKGDASKLSEIMRYNRSGRTDTETFFRKIGV